MIRPRGLARLAVMIWLALIGAANAGEAIIDAATGRLIAGVESDRPRFPASTTKLMTIYVALEAAAIGEVDLDARVTVSRHAAAAPPVKLGLKAGERIRLSDAIHAALIVSSNDAARVIAEAVSRSEAAFARRMTITARRIGMRNTTFQNASGLPHAGHISTAADIGRLILMLDQQYGRYLRPLFRAPVAWRGGEKRPRNNTVANVPGAKLGKTGFTCAAGYTAAVLVETAAGSRAIVTMANSGAGPRAASLKRLAKGKSTAHRFSPPCKGDAEKAPPPPVKPRSNPSLVPIGNWSLTLGVFSDKRDAIAALNISKGAVPSAAKIIATRETHHGFYAMVLADTQDQAEHLRRKLMYDGVKANLIDRSGRNALGLKVHSGL